MSIPLSQIGEFGLIERLQKRIPLAKGVIKGIGDDAAVLEAGTDSAKDRLLFTTDMLVEGVHFKPGARAQGVGHKALACNISDIAAMGGIPTYAVISLAAPGRTSYDYIKRIYNGLTRLARKFGIAIVGGDTVRAEKIIINVALLGKVKKDEVVTRDGAKDRDVIFVTGPLGRAWKTARHLSFTPRLKEAQFLVRRFKPSAMIDVSDGLLADLGHILKQSGKGAVLYEAQVPRNPGASLKEALSDGEDFELIFTVDQAKAKRLRALKDQRFRFYAIGQIIDGKKSIFIADGKGHTSKLEAKGFVHF